MIAEHKMSGGSQTKGPGLPFRTAVKSDQSSPARRASGVSFLRRGVAKNAARMGRIARQTAVLAARYPDSDPDNLRHTLILLGQPPLERLQRALLRAQKCNILASKESLRREKDKLVLPVLRDTWRVVGKRLVRRRSRRM